MAGNGKHFIGITLVQGLGMCGYGSGKKFTNRVGTGKISGRVMLEK